MGLGLLCSPWCSRALHEDVHSCFQVPLTTWAQSMMYVKRTSSGEGLERSSRWPITQKSHDTRLGVPRRFFVLAENPSCIQIAERWKTTAWSGNSRMAWFLNVQCVVQYNVQNTFWEICTELDRVGKENIMTEISHTRGRWRISCMISDQAISNATLSCDSKTYFIYELPKPLTAQNFGFHILLSIELPYTSFILRRQTSWWSTNDFDMILISGWCITQAVTILRNIGIFQLNRRTNYYTTR